MKRGSDYIPTAADLIGEAEACAKRREEAKAKGFRLGTYKVKYMLFGKPGERTYQSFSQRDALDRLKNEFNSVGLYPYDIEAEMLDPGNVYV